MEKLISYILQHYDPCSIIVYGSYADGSNGENSDFDALVITKDQECAHDTSFVHGVQMDVFLYPKAVIENQLDLEEVIQIFDGMIVFDTDNVAANLKQRVMEYLNNQPRKTKQQLDEEIAWCRKMQMRTKRMDGEGMFRWHWLLTDSLEIFCDILGRRYMGPKKTLKWMQKEYPQMYQIYQQALFHLDEQALDR